MYFYQGNVFVTPAPCRTLLAVAVVLSIRMESLVQVAAVMLLQVELLQPLIAACYVLLNACLQQRHSQVLHLIVFRQVDQGICVARHCASGCHAPHCTH
jgi:hypothetical protein